MRFYFELFGWGIELFAWANLKPIFGGSYHRARKLDPMPRLNWSGAKINHAYAEAYCPVGGIAIDLWKDVERKVERVSTSEKIQEFICKTVKDAGAQGVVVGLSGGIDSAVTAALCVKALGKEKVYGVIMPCSSNPDDALFAAKAARNLGITIYSRNLQEAYSKVWHLGPPAGWVSKLVEANIKSRLRMVILYAFANGSNRLVAGTSNRTELALGYFTKFGDGGVDFEPIGMLLKREVRALAKELDVPQEIIDRPPTAGLWDGQTDEDELGYTYDELDLAVEVVEGSQKSADVACCQFALGRQFETKHKNRMPLTGPKPEGDL